MHMHGAVEQAIREDDFVEHPIELHQTWDLMDRCGYYGAGHPGGWCYRAFRRTLPDLGSDG